MPEPGPALSQERREEIDRDLLTPMIAKYSDDGPTRERLRAVIDGSPTFKDGLLFAIDKGAFTGFVQGDPRGAQAAYDAHSKAIAFPTALLDDPYRATFVLGHETGHAVDRAINGDHVDKVFIPGVKQMLFDPKAPPGPRDYTGLIRDYIADERRNESEAHISGFNALSSRLAADHTRANLAIEDPLARRAVPPTAADLYAAFPEAMRDFMVVRGEAPDRTVALKPGLTRGDDGRLSLDTGTAPGRNNIEAMKVYFADRLPSSLGPNGALNYPHKTLLEGLELAHKSERVPDPTDKNYRPHYVVDFDNLGFEVNRGLMRTPMDPRIPSGGDFDKTFLPLLRPNGFANAVTGAQGLAERRMLEQATTALEGIDEGRLGVHKGTPAFDQLCAYTARVAGEKGMTAIGCVVPSDKGGLIISDKADPTNSSARLAALDPAKANTASGPEHMRMLGEALAPMLLDRHLDRLQQQQPPKPKQEGGSSGCVVM